VRGDAVVMSKHAMVDGRTGAREAGRGEAGWRAVLRRTLAEFQADALTDRAAALTYYAVLSIFPAMLALISIVGVVGQPATKPLLRNVGAFTPGAAKQILNSAVTGLTHGRGSAGLLFFLGLAGAIWAASGYVAAFMRAANVIWDVEEGRPIWKTLPLRVGVTLLAIVLLAASAIAVVISGGLARHAGKLLGLGSTAVTVWDIAKWPVLVVIAALLFALLYYASPNVRHPGFRAILPGGIVAVLLWIVASALFALYVANFGSYNKTYGSLGAIIIFLVWLWITNLAILFGAELNAEIARAHAIAHGAPPDREPYLRPRDTPG
jgi:membrane protein